MRRHVHDRPQRAPDRAQLVGGQGTDEVAVDAPQVGARGPAQAAEPQIGQDGLGAARIGRALRPVHEAGRHEAVDEARHAAPTEQDPVGQLAHPQAPLRRDRQLEERVVLGQRHRLLGAELLVQAPADERVRLEERPPVVEVGMAGRVHAGEGFAGHAPMIAHRGR